jgi:hypothetical protein
VKETPGRCPLSTRRIADEYSIENRPRLLEIASFPDRIDRSQDGEDPARNFRLRAFRQALQVLSEPGPARLPRNYPESLIRRVVYENPAEFLRQSPRFPLDAGEPAVEAAVAR